MSKTRTNRRPTVLRRRLGTLGLAALFVGGAAGCQPQTLSLGDASGAVAVTVTNGGQPVDTLLQLTSGTQHRSVQTGPDGTATVSVPAGTWTVHASAQGDPLEGDPNCFVTLVSDPDPTATVTSEASTPVTIELDAGPTSCF